MTEFEWFLFFFLAVITRPDGHDDQDGHMLFFTVWGLLCL